ncbi:MTH538 TIR-like domain [Butyrivibrio fibrisolvens DSM 3071]|uniref:MTH538 TIR-like domain n=1 Tax=Butyrivibrio fibrisolvens DSM 3071 TaxID=1121131 RepID=A0A1M5Q458_BUTFI|nr:TIR domain-containing protein [Butyrivibrio fibrisolvens]SHH08519.1 MTH538 TIR-like domain [Butyrivibrio fibrisolvens DSM 3071]
MKKRVFISFDYDHDSDLKAMLVGQSKNPDSPFEIVDMSIKEAISNDWKSSARRRIRGCDVVVVICGLYMKSASGVSAEIKIAQEEGTPYFLLHGRSNGATKPVGARETDKIYTWSWDNLKMLIGGRR